MMLNCHFMQPYAERDGCMKARHCPNSAARSGWCKEHAYVQEVLDAGAALGYPRMVALTIIERGKEKPVMYIGAGRANWEAYAESHPRRLHDEVMARLIRAQQEQKAKHRADLETIRASLKHAS